MLLKRIPRPALRPFVQAVWAMDETRQPWSVEARREHVLPTGQMHLVFRLSDDPLRLFADVSDTSGRIVGNSIVGGARASFYIREVSQPLCSVGAQLNPGAAQALFGVTADELAARHTLLGDLWGRAAGSMRERLADLGRVEQRLDAFEEMLAARLPRARGLHTAVAQALEQFSGNAHVRDVVVRSGYSHRMFISLFSRSVGLTPKLYSRVVRFRRALRRATAQPEAPWIDVAMAAGYTDQSHFVREFRELTGATPTAYRDTSPRFAHHLQVRSDQR